MTNQPSSVPVKEAPWKPRIWALHCPFNKSGFPVVGNFGRTERQVVIIDMATWVRMCEEIPGMATTEFEVGTYGD